MNMNNRNLTGQLAELRSMKAHTQRKLAAMYAGWAAVEDANQCMRRDNAEMRYVMAPFAHLLPEQEQQLVFGVRSPAAAAGAGADVAGI